MRQALEKLGLTQSEFARQLSEATGNTYSRHDVAKWTGARRQIPGAVQALLRAWLEIVRLGGKFPSGQEDDGAGRT